MPSDSNYRFPAQPFSIEEALALRDEVSALVHTAPLFGLKSKYRGQGSGARSVVGLYVGVNRQAHLFGFEPETKTWKAVAVVPDGEVTTLDGMGPRLDKLTQWLRKHYPDEQLVPFGKSEKRLN